ALRSARFPTVPRESARTGLPLPRRLLAPGAQAGWRGGRARVLDDAPAGALPTSPARIRIAARLHGRAALPRQWRAPGRPPARPPAHRGAIRRRRLSPLRRAAARAPRELVRCPAVQCRLAFRPRVLPLSPGRQKESGSSARPVPYLEWISASSL